MSISTSLTALQAAKTNIANAITAKGGTVGAGDGFGDFAADIGTITGGGGSLDARIDGTLTSVSSSVSAIKEYALYGCKNVTSAVFSNATNIDGYALAYMDNLTTASIPNVSTASTAGYQFVYCAKLKTVNMGVLQAVQQYMFNSCMALEKIDLPIVSSIAGSSFRYCNALTAIILRRTAGVASLAGTNALSNTPIASGSGYVYVPAALVESYKVATNWVTYAAKIRAIEDYPAITGG